MKIAHVVRTYAKYGGISRCVVELAERQSAEHEVHVYSAFNDHTQNPSIVHHRVPCVSFELLKKHKFYAVNNIFEVFSFAVAAWFMLRGHGYDIVHSQGDYLGISDVYTAQSCHKGWLSIFRQSTTSFVERIKKSRLNPLHLLYTSIAAITIRRSKSIVAISFGIKKELVRYCHAEIAKITVIPHGVNERDFSPEHLLFCRKKIRNEYGIADSDFVLIFPAHEFRRKGLPVLIESVKMLRDPDIKILVVGRDNGEPYQITAKQEGYARQLIFAGFQSKIEDYFAAADAMAFPTMYEPFGLVITEAMACGLPAIVPQSAGAAELITSGKDGVLLKSACDSIELANALKMLRDDHILRGRIGLEARNTAGQYTWDSIAQRYMEHYLSLTSNNVK